MLRRAITRRILVSGKRGSLQQELRCEAETFLEADSRLPAEELARAGDVGPGVADVACALRLLFVLDGAAEERTDRLGELVHGRRPAGGDVEDGSADVVDVARGDVRLHDVLHVGEVASLFPVAVD